MSGKLLRALSRLPEDKVLQVLGEHIHEVITTLLCLKSGKRAMLHRQVIQCLTFVDPVGSTG